MADPGVPTADGAPAAAAANPFRRRFDVREHTMVLLLLAAACFTVVISAAIIYILADGAAAFIVDPKMTLADFLLGTQWVPSGGKFGVLPLVTGTLVIAGGTLLVAAPLGIASAVYLSEFAGDRMRAVAKPVIEVLAGIPSIVYGFFALMVISPFLRDSMGADYFNALAAIIVMAVMTLPIIVSISDDAMRAVPQHLRAASYALGATRWETSTRVVMPAASSGIMASLLLGLGRALGETMVVLLAAGSVATLSLNPLREMQTMTAYIAQVATGDVPPGLAVDAAFAVGLYLFVITLVVNVVAARVVIRIKSGSSVRSGPTPAWRLRTAALRERTLGRIAHAVRRRDATQEIPLASRYRKQRMGQVLLASSFLFAVVFLVALIWSVLAQGLAGLSWDFVTGAPSWRAERAGIGPVIVGSVYLIGLTMVFAIPIGVGAAVYLTEFARDNRFTRFLRVVLSNLAGVPSIVFGLLGMALFVRVLGMGPSLMAGALTLSIMVLPIVVVATEEALKTVPKAFRDAALSLGATRWQAVRHHVLPNALPGIMTGSVLSLARALGETAPILFIAALYANVAPSGILDGFMALPVTIFYWTQHHDPAFHDLAASTILVLLMIMLSMNAIAIAIRNRAEKRREW
jgi:phosphate ABC transporter permease subunit PstA/phosphate ABC transporter permease protein PstC